MTDLDAFEEVSNPLDSVEEIMCANDWVFDRTHDDHLRVTISGSACEYAIDFTWDDNQSAMQFSCVLDTPVSPLNLMNAVKTLSVINSTLWLGHFDFEGDKTFTPRFRHTSLFRGMTCTSGVDHIEDLVDIALSECERYFPVFHMFAQNAVVEDIDVGLALMNSEGTS